MKGVPYNEQSLEKNWASGHLAQSHICHVHCFSVIIQLCFLPLGCSSSCLDSKQASTAQGKGQHAVAQAPPLAVTGLDTTQSSGSAFSAIFYRILEQVNFRRVSRWVL